MKRCDLHTHTVYSDGTLTPTELVLAAVREKLSAVALTDHNSVGGLDEFMSQAERCGIIGVAGVEFSTEYNGVELHIHGLFVEREHFDAIREFVDRFKVRKRESNIKLVKRLGEAGYKVDLDEIERNTPDGYVNRAHIAAALVRSGYVGSVREAFDKLVGEKAGYYEPPIRSGAFETIEFIKSIGALAVLAHPLLQLGEQELYDFLAVAVEHGLDGIETEYSLYTERQIDCSERLAEHFGLCRSGGSDFHGENKPDQKLGSGKNNICVPFEYYEKLLAKKL